MRVSWFWFSRKAFCNNLRYRGSLSALDCTMPGTLSMCMVISLSSEELLRATSCNNGCVMSCCADAVEQVLRPLPPSFNNDTTLRHWVACKPGMLFFRVANCSWGLSSCDSFRLDMACTEWVIKAKKRLRMALNIYLVGINTIPCFFFPLPALTHLFFFLSPHKVVQPDAIATRYLLFDSNVPFSFCSFAALSSPGPCKAWLYKRLQVEMLQGRRLQPSSSRICTHEVHGSGGLSLWLFSNCRNRSRHVFANTWCPKIHVDFGLLPRLFGHRLDKATSPAGSLFLFRT